MISGGALISIQKYISQVALKKAMCIRWAFRSSAWHPSREEWMFASGCIEKEEQERIGKFMFKRDAKSSLSGRLLMRKAVHDLLRIPYNSIQFGRTDKGKPYLLEAPSSKKLSFNVSHQGDYTVLSASFDYITGIDVMKIDWIGREDLGQFFYTMRKQFTDHEWDTIKGFFTEEEQLESFYRHWCLKESYVKALGIGIANDLCAFDFHPEEDDIPEETVLSNTKLHVNGQLAKEWIFEESRLGKDHLVAVALFPQDSTRIKPIDQKEKVAFPLTVLSYHDLISTAIPFTRVSEEYWNNYAAKQEKPNLM